MLYFCHFASKVFLSFQILLITRLFESLRHLISALITQGWAMIRGWAQFRDNSVCKNPLAARSVFFCVHASPVTIGWSIHLSVNLTRFFRRKPYYVPNIQIGYRISLPLSQMSGQQIAYNPPHPAVALNTHFLKISTLGSGYRSPTSTKLDCIKLYSVIKLWTISTSVI